MKIGFNYLWPSCISAHQNGRSDVTIEQSTDKTIWSCSRCSNVPVKLTNYIKQRKTQGEETKQREKYHGFLHCVKPTVRGKIVLFGCTNISWPNNITQVRNSGTTQLPIKDEQLINWLPLSMIHFSEVVTF